MGTATEILDIELIKYHSLSLDLVANPSHVAFTPTIYYLDRSGLSGLLYGFQQ